MMLILDTPNYLVIFLITETLDLIYILGIIGGFSKGVDRFTLVTSDKSLFRDTTDFFLSLFTFGLFSKRFVSLGVNRVLRGDYSVFRGKSLLGLLGVS